MPGLLVALVSKLTRFGTTAKAAVLATAVAITVTAGAAAVGVLHLTGGTSASASAEVAPITVPAASEAAGPAAVPPADTPVAPTTVAAAPTSATLATVAATKATRPSAAAPPTTVAATAPATTAPAKAISTPAPAAPVGVARRTPSEAEVQQAIKTFPKYVRTFITPTPSMVDQLGNEVCTAFDQGLTFAQVKATGLQMVTQVPKTTILAGGADWVVRTAVALYCPGHAPKLA